MTDISSTFTTTTEGSNVKTTAPLTAVLGPLLGGEIVGGSTGDAMQSISSSQVEAVSVFGPRDCTVGEKQGSSAGVSSEGEDLIEMAGSPLVVAFGRMEKEFRLIKRALIERGEVGIGIGIGAMKRASGEVAAGGVAGDRGAPLTSCWSYRHTVHGPTGLFRFSSILRVRVSGTVQLLGGLKTFSGGTDVWTRVDYSVNTYLKGVAGWVKNSDTGIAEPPTDAQGNRRTVEMESTRKCTGDATQSCQSDRASDVMEVFVTYKKVFIAEVTASGSTVGTSVDIDAYLARQTEASFRGTVNLDHFIGAGGPES